MKGTLENKLGKVSIDSEVIAQYAGSTAVECFGIVGMAAVSMKDGLVKLLKGDSLTRGMNPYITLVLSFLAGAVAGICTGLIHVKCKVRDLLSGIIMTVSYTHLTLPTT